MIQNNILVNNNSNNSLRFFSSLCETNSILQPSWGTGPGTFSCASAQYITDFEGVTRKVESGSVAVEGSRVVTNLLTYSEDLSNAAWGKSTYATITGTRTFTPTAQDGRIYHLLPDYTYVLTRNVSVILSGTPGKTINIYLSDGVSTVGVGKQVTLSAVPTRYSISTSAATVSYVLISADSKLGIPLSDYNHAVIISGIQYENVTGQTNQNPGEYIKTTSAAVTKCFSTTNGNTVDANGVVTEATGTALPQSYPERQNSTAYALNDKIQVAGWWYYCTTAGTTASSAPTFPQGYAGSQTVTDGTAVWTIGGRLLLGYVSEPASSNKVTAYGIIPADTLGSELSSGSLTIGQKYQITARTDANFVADGAADNVVGTQFVATAATVTLDAGDKVKRVQWGVGEKSFHNGTSFVQNITGLTLSGDVAVVLSIVTDQTEIEKAGLAGINPGYKVYKLDNSAGSGTATVAVSGTTGNTNAHSIRVTVRKSAGSGSSVLQLLSGTGATAISGSVYSKIVSTNLTPSGTTQTLNVIAGIGDTIYFLLPQLEELPYATSVMPTAGATATRAATSLSYPTAGNLSGNDVTVGVDSFLNFSPGPAYYPWSTGTSLSDRLAWLNGGTTSFLASKIISGIDKYSTITLTVSQGKIYKTLLRLSKTSGITGFVNNVKGTTDTNTVDAVLGANLYLGASFDGSTIQPSYLRNLRIYWKALSDDRCKQLTL